MALETSRSLNRQYNQPGYCLSIDNYHGSLQTNLSIVIPQVVDINTKQPFNSLKLKVPPKLFLRKYCSKETPT